MKKVVKLTESDLMNLIKRVIKEQSEASKLDSHRNSCKEKFVGKSYTFEDPRGLRKEKINFQIDSVELDFAETGNMFTRQANQAARAGGIIARIKGHQSVYGKNASGGSVAGDKKEYEFKLSCQNEGNFTLISGPKSDGVRVNDTYVSYPLWTALVKNLKLCGEPDNGQYYCNI